MADASMGFQSRLSLAPAGTAIAGYTEAYEFVSEGLQKRQTILETAGLRVERTRPNPYDFLSERARNASARYGVKSISLLAVKPRTPGGVS